jgi:SAM-dependent methyltransferase
LPASRPHDGGTVLAESGDHRQAHWDAAYAGKGEQGVSWFEPRPETSLAILRAIGADPELPLVDIGGGASQLVDALLDGGWRSVSVLDLSEEALSRARRRLGSRAERVDWIAADVTKWQPDRVYGTWHDRAAFHFLVDEADRNAYVSTLRRALAVGGHAVLATFASDGPERCSGLPVARYDAAALAEVLGPGLELLDERRHRHQTPWGASQSFQYAGFRRTA